MTKRRFVEQLPVYNQTETLKKFFGATVDQLFQPANNERISGYVGQVPSYSDPTTDFYIAEPTIDRQTYGLEPGMVSYNLATTTLSNSLVYADLVAYLKGIGANVSNHQRLFETEYYSWCPPINVDMLVNFNEYYWFGDQSGDVLPILNIVAPVNTYIDGGLHPTVFALPNSIPGTTEIVAAYVNYIPVGFVTVGNTVVLAVPPNTGDIICVTRLSDLRATISGSIVFPLTGLLQLQTGSGERDPSYTGQFVPSVAALSSGMRVRLIDTTRIFSAWDAQFLDYGSTPPVAYQLPWDESTWDLGASAEDGVFYVDGVGQSIRLTPYGSIIRDLNAQYITIDRSSFDQNPWSLRNSWVHVDTFAWSNLTFNSRQAQRPILEFVRDIVLYGWGTTSGGVLTPVQAVLSTKTASLVGPVFIDVPEIVGQPVGTITVDNGVILENGMRFLVRQSSTDAVAWNNMIYTVGNSAGLYTLTQDGAVPASGDTVPLTDGAIYSLNGNLIDGLVFNGATWRPAQTWSDQAEPLFMLYDIDGVALDDPGRYPGSNFLGNRIFGFQHASSGAMDPLLRFPLVYDSNGYIEFQNDLAMVPYTASNGTITVMRCAGVFNAVFAEPLSEWWPTFL